MEEKKMAIDAEGYIKSLVDTVQRVITNPAGFYQAMPKEGGLVEPLIFMASMGVVAGIIRTILGIAGIGRVASFSMALASIIILPIAIAIFGFISAGILFGIWKAMGSEETYEVAYRCLAYATAISPISAIINIFPYIGPIIGLLWMTYLLVNASTEVHRIQPKPAWVVFGAICAILAVASISTQLAARRYASKLNTLQNIEKMKPEEAGKAMGEFMKGFQQGSGKQ